MDFDTYKAKLTPQYWTKTEHFTFNGQTNKVYQRDDLIDLKRVDYKGRTSRELMKRGNAPVGPDHKPINLHHTIQTYDGGLAEVTQTFHQQHTRTIHINPPTIPSGIDRERDFTPWRKAYWKNRLTELEKQ